MTNEINEVSAIMADLGIASTPAPQAVSLQPANAMNLTPANASSPYASSGPGGARVMNMQPANAVSFTPANASSPYASSGPGGAQPMSFGPGGAQPGAFGPGGSRVMNMQPANAVNMQPANASSPYASSGPGGAQPMSFGPGGASAGPGGAGRVVTLTAANSSSPYASSGPGGAQPMSFGPGGASAGPGGAQPMSFGPGGASAGPGAQSIFFGPGAAKNAGPSFGPGANFGPGKGPGAIHAGGVKNDEPIKMATHTPDGREIIHKGPPCANCGEMVIGQCTNALGKTYHPEHFVCFCCSQPFKDGKFMIKDNEPYCETDYYELYGNKCRTCGESIKKEYIQAEKFFFHPDHFICMRCGKRLVGQKYKIQTSGDQDLLCLDCHVKNLEKIEAEAKICAKCKQPIIGEYITLKGQTLHPEHFRCAECGCPFTGGNCHEHEGELYCLEHYELMLKKTCAKCGKPILGRGVSAVGRMWHPEHFGCHVCGETLNGSSFFEKDGEAYCETHYTQLFGVMCAKCGKAVLGGGKVFLDKHYHEDHLCCSVCETLLKSGKIREWDSKPYCEKCYDKLPSEVRKKYEKKRELEMRNERMRQRDAVKAEKERLKKEKEKNKNK